MRSAAWTIAFISVLLIAFPVCSEAEPPSGPVVVLSTSMGDIRIGLYEKEAPETVRNFLGYVNDGFYNGTIFHRVIAGFMIQAGGFTQDMQQKETRPAVSNEADNGLRNEKGTVAMARTNAIHSATSQFFINVADNAFLDHQGQSNFGYCVFGRVIEGLEVVEKIKGVQTGRRGMYDDVPLKPEVIQSASVESSAGPADG